jgi:hypothetical protein
LDTLVLISGKPKMSGAPCPSNPIPTRAAAGAWQRGGAPIDPQEPPLTAAGRDAGLRATCDAFCLWHLCPRAACRRRRYCVARDPGACLKRLAPLVPEGARRYALMRIVARRNGLSEAEADVALADHKAVLEDWTAVCRAARGTRR